MPLYECTFIARHDASQADVDKLMDEYSSIVSTQGGKVEKREYWGLRTLAYHINKSRKGHYVMLGVNAPSAAVKEVERLSRFNENIIRYMAVRVEKLPEGPSAMMLQANNENEELFIPEPEVLAAAGEDNVDTL